MKITQNKKNRGITLLQMVIVIVILGIIVKIAIPAVKTTVTDTRNTKITTTLRRVDEAKIRYYMDTKDAAAPTRAALAPYLETVGTGGEEIFYSSAAWTSAGKGAVPANIGKLLDNIPGAWIINPNARNVPATYVP